MNDVTQNYCPCCGTQLQDIVPPQTRKVIGTGNIHETCPFCHKSWAGDGWTLVCPFCGKHNTGNL